MLALLAVTAALAPGPAGGVPLVGVVHGSRAQYGSAAHGGRRLGCLRTVPLPAPPVRRFVSGAARLGEPPLTRRLRAALHGFPDRAFRHSAVLRTLLSETALARAARRTERRALPPVDQD